MISLKEVNELILEYELKKGLATTELEKEEYEKKLEELNLCKEIFELYEKFCETRIV